MHDVRRLRHKTCMLLCVPLVLVAGLGCNAVCVWLALRRRTVGMAPQLSPANCTGLFYQTLSTQSDHQFR